MQIRHIISSRNLIFKTKQKPASQLAMVAMKQQIGSATTCEKIILEKTKNCTVNLPEYIMTAPTATFQVHLLQKDIEGEGFVLYKRTMSSEVTQFSVAVVPRNPNPTKDPDLTQVQLKTLLTRSFELLDDKMQVLSHVYRNKQNTYFRALEDDHCGIMETVLKNHNGDQGSCINGQIQGIFLSTTLTKNGNIPMASYFGSHSVRIEASKLLNKETNLYFADLYCHYVNHHVTVVATRPGSQADRFCKLKLVPLDATNNRFLQILDNEVYVVRGVIVELFYTEEVDLRTMSIETPKSIHYAEVHALGRGKTRKNGIPKNKKCQICVL